MITPPTAPSPGKPVSAGFFYRLISWAKSGMIVEGKGYRIRRTPNGTSLDIDVSDRKDSSSLPWAFSCIEDEISGERTGGWSNCILQLGYNKFLRSPDVKHVKSFSGSNSISGSETTDDGDYYVEIDLSEETARILVNDGTISSTSPNDPEKNLVRIWIGTVRAAKLVQGIHHHPVVYKYA